MARVRRLYDPPIDPLISVPEMAKALGRSEGYVYRLLESGLIPSTRDGRAWRVQRTEFEAFRTGKANEPEAAPQPEPVRIVLTPEMLATGRPIVIEIRPAPSPAVRAVR